MSSAAEKDDDAADRMDDLEAQVNITIACLLYLSSVLQSLSATLPRHTTKPIPPVHPIWPLRVCVRLLATLPGGTDM